MARRIFTYKGKTLEDLQKLTLQEFAKMVPASARRRLKRGFNPQEKKFVAKLIASTKEVPKPTVRTHSRDIIITPHMVGAMVAVHSGKEFVAFQIIEQMIGYRLGEFVSTRRRVQHGAPGIGATKSSLFVPLK